MTIKKIHTTLALSNDVKQLPAQAKVIYVEELLLAEIRMRQKLLKPSIWKKKKSK